VHRSVDSLTAPFRRREPLVGADRRFRWCLTAAALAYAVGATLRTGWGADYASDAGPALAHIARGDLAGFFHFQPAMGAFSLFVRAPFVIAARALHLNLYGAGSLPCVLSVVVVGLWLARRAAARGMGRAGQAALVAACLLNPLVGASLYWGHPEELLTASLAVGALLAADEDRLGRCVLLAGLAVATKQWAAIFVVPCVLILPRGRVRAAVGIVAVAALVTLPMVLADFGAFMRMYHYIARPQDVVTLFTWLYPFSPTGVVHITNPFGDSRSFIGHQLTAVVASVSRPAIIMSGVALPLLAWWRDRRVPAARILRLLGIACVVRCSLDPGGANYYLFPLLLVLAAIDIADGRSFPAASVVGALTAFVVLDRAWAYLDPPVVNVLYVLASAVTIALLARGARAGGRSPARRPVPSALAAALD
jgi:hypothetical protein